MSKTFEKQQKQTNQNKNKEKKIIKTTLTWQSQVRKMLENCNRELSARVLSEILCKKIIAQA